MSALEWTIVLSLAVSVVSFLLFIVLGVAEYCRDESSRELYHAAMGSCALFLLSLSVCLGACAVHEGRAKHEWCKHHEYLDVKCAEYEVGDAQQWCNDRGFLDDVDCMTNWRRAEWRDAHPEKGTP